MDMTKNTKPQATTTTAIENVKIGDTLVVGRDANVITDIQVNGETIFLKYPAMSPWGPTTANFAARVGTEVKVIAA